MPEGDSIHKLASALAPLLEGREVTAFMARRIADADAALRVGHRIVAVDARGKNLLVRFDDDKVLHVHLRMEGRIAIERRRSPFYTAPRGLPDLRLAVDGGAIVGHRLPVCRLVTSAQAKRELARLGPDLVDGGFDAGEALRRLKELGDREIGDALLVQSAMAGIGNVYKSEVLFLERIDPRARVAAIDDERLARVIARASALLRRNLGQGPRTTRQALRGARLWVYGRAGQPCFRCGATVERIRQGTTPGRSTYLCPRCPSEHR